MIRLRFLAEDGIASFAVRKFTWSPFSHVELALPDGYLGARYDGGVLLRKLDYCKPSRQAFATVQTTPEQAAAIIDFASKQIGKPYDWTCIVGITLHEDWFNRKRWICSELVAASFAKAGLPLLDLPLFNRITPGMIAQSPLVVWEKPSAVPFAAV